MAKTQWNDHLKHYRGTEYNVGEVVRFAQGQEAKGYDVLAVLSLVALQFPIQAKATWGMADQSIKFAHYEPDGAPFESETYNQLKTIGRLTRNADSDPLAAAMALMPDAHPGKGMPIGGVIALKNALMPNAVGVDIACRVTGTTWMINDVGRAIAAIQKIARFGFDENVGPDAQDAPVMYDPLWSEIPLLRGLKDKAQRQLGTSGSGNHFIDLMEIVGRPGFYMLVTHSGSRGTGAKVGEHYIKLAQDVCPGKAPDGYHWIPADTDAGREYWAVMNLMGRYAATCHHLIHARFALAAGDAIERSPFFYSIGIDAGIPFLPYTEEGYTATVDGKTKGVRVSMLENHHNFAWKEEWPDVGTVYIHRKGATPAAAGQWGIIPGSSGSYSYIVEGKYGNLGHGYETANINSASHGAGRPRSRSASKALHDATKYAQATKQFAVQHDGVAPDETVFAYKDIESVMEAQRDIVYRRATLKPIFVKMGGLKGDDGD